MIKDISRIREELEGYNEVFYPYEFPKGIHIKYITLRGEDESFYPGGKFQCMGDNCLYVVNSYKRWKIPLKLFTKAGSVRYQTRLFIPENESETCSKESLEHLHTIKYQQHIIDTMVQRIQSVETTIQKQQDMKESYEELLQQNRYHLKQLTDTLMEKDSQLQQAYKVIQRLTQG